jgi:hypothetical protein
LVYQTEMTQVQIQGELHLRPQLFVTYLFIRNKLTHTNSKS